MLEKNKKDMLAAMSLKSKYDKQTIVTDIYQRSIAKQTHEDLKIEVHTAEEKIENQTKDHCKQTAPLILLCRDQAKGRRVKTGGED